MEIGESMIIGRMGNQPLTITDSSVSVKHAEIKRISQDVYTIEDLDSDKGTFAVGLRIKYKHIRKNTPIILGTYKTSIEQLLKVTEDIDLEALWTRYENEKHKWDRYSTLVNSIRMLVPVLTLILSQIIGQNWIVSISVLVVVTTIAIFASEKVMDKKTVRMSEMNSEMQENYLCKHCHRFLGFVPYKVLVKKKYCPSCGVPIE